MSRKKTSAVSFLLLLALSSPLVAGVTSCSDNSSSSEPPVSESTAATEAQLTTEAETELSRANTPDTLPDLDFQGETFKFYIDDSNHDYTGLNNYFQGPEELTGDIVYDTVIARNQKVEERLNASLEYYVVSYTYDKVTAATRKYLLAGEELDVMVEQQWGNSQLVAEGMFLNAYDGQYFDFSQPWWWNSHMDNAAIGADQRIMLAGDYFLDIFRSTYIVYFNKNIFEDHFGSSDDLYNQVFDGGWTFDTFGEYAAEVYTDIDGDNTKNDGDLFGFTTSVSAIVDHFVYGTDVQFSSRDEDGFPVITMNNPRAVQLAEALYHLSYENDGAKLYTDDGVLRSQQEQLFMSNQLLFLPYSISTADILRDMENDFGMLPFPKLDESQENYRVINHDTALTGFIPVTCTKLDKVSAVLEALCAESYRSVMPAYYETALKVKYVRDNLSAQMVDLIHDSVSAEFIYIYSPALSDLGTFYRSLISGKTADFASKYATYEPKAQAKLEALIEAYKSFQT